MFDTGSGTELEIIGVGRIFDVLVRDAAHRILNLIKHLFDVSERLAGLGADPSPQFPRN